MPIRYDAIVLAALAAELDELLAGADVGWIAFDGDAGTARLVTRDRPSILFRLDRRDGQVLAAVDTESKPARRELSAWRDMAVRSITVPPDERRLLIELAPRAGTGRRRTFVVELHTNSWNALLVASDSGRIEDVLWARNAGGRSLRRGALYVPPTQPRLWCEAAPTADAWTAELEHVPAERRRPEALDRVAFLSTINVDAVLGEWGAGGPPDELRGAYERYVVIRATPDAETGAWILDRKLGPQPYPTSLDECSAVRAPSLLDAMRTAFEAGADPSDAARATSTPDAETLALRERLTRILSRARRRAASLARELDSADDTARLRQSGQLLLANKTQVRRGEISVVVPGFDGADVEIELDPRLGPVENAERLFDEARRRERAAARIPGLIEAARGEAARLESALETLEESGPSDELWEIVGGRGDAPSAARPGDTPVRLPYRTLRTTGGLEIRVGRGARANDDLTLRHSSPEDIWLHARQSPGAHVILRWGRRDQNPPRADLVQAAVVAALNSDARHSGMVAVDWTRRKYVRKPRKAAPGAVIPERVKTLFVEPDPDLPARLAPPT